MQADRRRINAPAGGTAPPVFAAPPGQAAPVPRPARRRTPDEHRKIFLRTGVVPSASGSAYYEIPPAPSPDPPPPTHPGLVPAQSSLKITCTVHGPKPLPRNAAFSPNLLVAAHVKFAPFATRVRRGYVRDASERDLAVHLETALRGVVLGERWPKSGIDVVVTVLEGEEDAWWADGGQEGSSGTGKNAAGSGGGWGAMSVLAGAITVASAALVDAGIDCVDLVSGGVAAMVQDAAQGSSNTDAEEMASREVQLVLDPSPPEHASVKAACVVAYLQSRDEMTELWMKGETADHGTAESGVEALVNAAVKAASLSRMVLAEAVKESVELKLQKGSDAVENGGAQGGDGGVKLGGTVGKDVVMNG